MREYGYSDDGSPGGPQRVVLAGTLQKKHANNTFGILRFEFSFSSFRSFDCHPTPKVLVQRLESAADKKRFPRNRPPSPNNKHKRNAQGKQYDKRFFVLTHDHLIYRHSPMDEDPNEKTFEIRHLMSVTKLGSRSIELRFTERTLVVKCGTDEEYDRWFKALDLVRFQPLPYDVEAKEVPVPQIVPPIVPRIPVDEAEPEDPPEGSGRGGFPTMQQQMQQRSPSRGQGEGFPVGGPHPYNQYNAPQYGNTSKTPSAPVPARPHHMNGQQQPGGHPTYEEEEVPQRAGLSTGRMRTSSLLEKEIADMVKLSGVDPLVPPKFLKRLSQGSLDVMMTGQNTAPSHQHVNYSIDSTMSAHNTHGNPSPMPGVHGQLGMMGGRGGAPNSQTAPSHAQHALANPVPIQLTSGGRRMAMHQGPRENPPSPSPSPPTMRPQALPTALQAPRQSVLPLPDLDTGELSPRSRLAKGNSSAKFVLNGTLPSEEPSPAPSALPKGPSGKQASGLGPLQGRLSDDYTPPPQPSSKAQAAPAGAKGAAQGKKEGDMLTFTDDDDSFFASTPVKDKGRPAAQHRFAVGNSVASLAPADKSSMELILDEDFDGAGRKSQGSRPQHPPSAPTQRDHARHTQGGDWLDEDFDSEEEGQQQRKAHHQPQQQQSVLAPRAQAPPLRSTSSSNNLKASAPVVPRPPGGPKPTESFSRPVLAPTPPSGTSRAPSFRRPRPGSGVPPHASTSGQDIAPAAPPAPKVMSHTPPPHPSSAQALSNASSKTNVVAQPGEDTLLEDWDD